MRGRYRERKMRKRERESAMLDLVKATGYWEWRPSTPYRLDLKVQEGSPNAWIASQGRPWERKAPRIIICLTLPLGWDKRVHAEGCAVVDGDFLLDVEWTIDNTLEIDQVGKCVWASRQPATYNEALQIVRLNEGFIAGHGGGFALGNTVRVAVTHVIEKWESALGIVPRENRKDELPF